jgi:hypothetical protein
VDGAGEYYFYVDDLAPGDTIIRKLTVRNLEATPEPYALSVLAEPLESTGEVDWLDNLHLQVLLNGEPVYEGRLRGDGKPTAVMPGNGVDMIKDGVPLGTYKPGEYSTVTFVVRVDSADLSYERLMEKSVAKIRWNFIAIQTVPVDAPRTGESLFQDLFAHYGLHATALLLLLLLVYVYRRYKKQLKENLSG